MCWSHTSPLAVLLRGRWESNIYDKRDLVENGLPKRVGMGIIIWPDY